jgi:hypothetical protein
MTPHENNPVNAAAPLGCAEFEIILCDYIDGTLSAAERAAVESHQRSCPACAQFAQDVTCAVDFISRSADVVTPPELLTKIAFDIPVAKKVVGRSWIAGWLQPFLQPRYVMGMAMTILSFSMLAKFAGVQPRQLRPSDLNPVRIWEAADDRVHRVWERGVKYYESMLLVYEVQSRLKEWNEQEEEERKLTSGTGSASVNGSRVGEKSTTEKGNTKK